MTAVTPSMTIRYPTLASLAACNTWTEIHIPTRKLGRIDFSMNRWRLVMSRLITGTYLSIGSSWNSCYLAADGAVSRGTGGSRPIVRSDRTATGLDPESANAHRDVIVVLLTSRQQ